MLYIIQQILTGFLVKSIASFDDTLTRIPILSEITQTIKGKIAFSIGTLLSLTVILIIAIFFSFLLDLIPFRQQVLAFIVFLLALSVYFELFTKKENQNSKHVFSQIKPIAHSHFVKLIAIGFFISFITLLDDALILASLFIGDNISKILSAIGVYLATLAQIISVIFFSHKINKIKYKKEIATVSLIILAILVGLGVI